MKSEEGICGVRGTEKGRQREYSRGCLGERRGLCSAQHAQLSRRAQKWGCEKKWNRLEKRKATGRAPETDTGDGYSRFDSCTAQEDGRSVAFGVLSSAEKLNIMKKHRPRAVCLFQKKEEEKRSSHPWERDSANVIVLSPCPTPFLGAPEQEEGSHLLSRAPDSHLPPRSQALGSSLLIRAGGYWL